jgi:hypothetical protein
MKENLVIYYQYLVFLSLVNPKLNQPQRLMECGKFDAQGARRPIFSRNNFNQGIFCASLLVFQSFVTNVITVSIRGNGGKRETVPSDNLGRWAGLRRGFALVDHHSPQLGLRRIEQGKEIFILRCVLML